jgi:hypothetical protein
MRRDIWLEPSDLDERPQPTGAGFGLTIIVMILVVLVAGVVLGSCGVPWWMLD